MYHVSYCLLLVTLKFYTKQDKTAKVLKFSDTKVHHFMFIRGRYAKSMLAVIPGAVLFQKFYFFFSFLFCLFQLYIKKFQYVAVLRTGEIIKERSCAIPTLIILIYNKIIKQTVKPLFIFRICQASICYNLR